MSTLLNVASIEPIPFRSRLAVSVSLPKMQNTIECQEDAKIKDVFPFSYQNRFVTQLTEFIKEKYCIDKGKNLIPIASIKAKNIIEEGLRVTFDYIEDDCENVFLVIGSEDKNEKSYVDFIDHAGLMISARKAESSLLQCNLIDTLLPEENLSFVQAISNIHRVLGKAYATNTNNIVLCNSGTNAHFAAMEAILSYQNKLGKTTSVQLEWLDVGTMEVIEIDKNHIQIAVFDLEHLENWLRDHHENVAVLATEIATTNPLVPYVDLPRLYALCSRFSVKLIVDNTIASPNRSNPLPYCDMVVERLTGNVDLLFGAIILKDSRLISQIYDWVIYPFDGEIKRLGLEILVYEDRVTKIPENTVLR
jgi:cystathionine gamma-synthase